MPAYSHSIQSTLNNMTWIKDSEYTWYEKLALNVIKCGTVPNHIAIIMDGNRRFAKNANLEKIQGHSKGFDKLSECLRWCLDLGVKEITTFAFSIENFKRNDDEVRDLMDLAKIKFGKLLEEEERLRENGVRIRIVGNIKLLPQDLQELMARAVLMTEMNDKLFLNIAFAYTSRDEITNAIQTICADPDGDLIANDITESLIDRCLYTRDTSNPDLLVRTSGETRLSDFLMWQLSSSVLYFTKTLWPAMTIWHLLYGVFIYQQSLFSISKYKRSIEDASYKSYEAFPDRVKNFLRKVEQARHDYMVNLTRAKWKDD